MFSIEAKGLDKVENALKQLGPRMAKVFLTAMYEEAEIEMTEAKERTPVDTGELKRSGRVRLRGGASPWDAEVVLMFGGPLVPYAVYVHENLDAYHKVGQAKFLESVLVESRPYLASRIAKRAIGMLGSNAMPTLPIRGMED